MRLGSRLYLLFARFVWFVARYVPPLQKRLWRRVYNRLVTNYPHPEWVFLNLGYIGESEAAPVLEPADEVNRLSIQLYHHVGTLAPLTGRRVLEVGCGRGGGASYVKRYLGPASMVGMDLAQHEVDFCRGVHRVEGLSFRQGDAEKMPFGDAEFDVVINVESSHCYGRLEEFFREVKRVLAPGGAFLYADAVLENQLAERRSMLGRCGFEIVQEHDITPNVLASLDSTTEPRLALVQAVAPTLTLKGAREFISVPGSAVYEGMRAKTLRYVSMELRPGPRLATGGQGTR